MHRRPPGAPLRGLTPRAPVSLMKSLTKESCWETLANSSLVCRARVWTSFLPVHRMQMRAHIAASTQIVMFIGFFHSHGSFIVAGWRRRCICPGFRKRGRHLRSRVHASSDWTFASPRPKHTQCNCSYKIAQWHGGISRQIGSACRIWLLPDNPAGERVPPRRSAAKQVNQESLPGDQDG